LTAVALVVVGGLAGLLLAYDILRRTKAAGVRRLVGHSRRGVWFDLAGRMVATTWVGSIVAVGLSALAVRDADLSFPLSAAAVLTVAYGGLAAISLAATIYTTHLPLAAAIKGRDDSHVLFLVNAAITAACAVAAIMIGAGLADAGRNIEAQRAQLGNWELAAGYGVFTPLIIGGDLEEIKQGRGGPAEDLYPGLAEQGALFVDASPFQQVGETPSPSSALPSMKVNTNYIARFPILDERGAPVQIDPNDTSWIVLAPASKGIANGNCGRTSNSCVPARRARPIWRRASLVARFRHRCRTKGSPWSGPRPVSGSSPTIPMSTRAEEIPSPIQSSKCSPRRTAWVSTASGR